MPHRTITDGDGVTWDVWEVHPTLSERRELRERRGESRSPDRRQRVEERPMVAHQLRYGWLAFQSNIERRRRAPIPHDWEAMQDKELLDVLDHAERTRPARF